MTTPRRTFGVENRQWRRLAGLAIVLGAVWMVFQHVDERAVHAWAARLNGPMVFAGLVVLPLLGFPVSLLHVVAGVRFGTTLGIALVAASILLQLLASYALVHARHDAFARRFDALKKRIPKGAHGNVTLFTLLLPGVPYFAKNYLLPLLGVPLRTYLLWCFPTHTLRSMVAVFFGDKSSELTPARLVFFLCYGGLLAGLCAWSFVRLKAKIETSKEQSHAGTAATAAATPSARSV